MEAQDTPAESSFPLFELPRDLLPKVVLLTVDKFEEPLWTYADSAR
jgi:hypothetical protein